MFLTYEVTAVNEKYNLKKGIGLMVLSSVCACVGQLGWKLFALQADLRWLLAGFSLYFIGALLMIVAYRFGKLSVLQPILSLNYVFSLLLAAIVLSEHISVLKIIGVLFIVYGLKTLTARERL